MCLQRQHDGLLRTLKCCATVRVTAGMDAASSFSQQSSIADVLAAGGAGKLPESHRSFKSEPWRARCALRCSPLRWWACPTRHTSTGVSCYKWLARCARPGGLLLPDMMPEGIELACCSPNLSSLLQHRQQAVRLEVLTPCCRGRRRRPLGPQALPGTAPPGPLHAVPEVPGRVLSGRRG